MLEHNIDRIVSTKKRLDVLMLSLALTTAFAFFYRDCEFGHAELFGLKITHQEPYYHFSIAVVLLIVFGLVGSHFIEYMAKRGAYDELLQSLNEQHTNMIIKSTVPNSFYEFTYMLKDFKTNDKLRELAIGVLLCTFYISHFIALIHIWERIDLQTTQSVFFLISISLILIALYIGFITSAEKSRKGLGKQVRQRVILWAVVIVICSSLLYNF